MAHSRTVAEVAKRFGVDTSRVGRRIYARSLYALKHRGAWLIPAFQLRRHKLVHGLDAVVKCSRQRCTLSPQPVAHDAEHLVVDRAAVSPIHWLAAGGSPEMAAGLAEAIDQL